MSLTRVFSCAFVVVFAVACGSDSISPSFKAFAYSSVTPQCGPADGPAVAVFLAPSLAGANGESAPYVRVYVAVSVDQLAGVWPTKSAATAWFQSDASTSEVAESGYMFVRSVDSDNTVTGYVDLQFPNAGHIKTDFRAKFRPTSILCA